MMIFSKYFRFCFSSLKTTICFKSGKIVTRKIRFSLKHTSKIQLLSLYFVSKIFFLVFLIKWFSNSLSCYVWLCQVIREYKLIASFSTGNKLTENYTPTKSVSKIERDIDLEKLFVHFCMWVCVSEIVCVWEREKLRGCLS